MRPTQIIINAKATETWKCTRFMCAREDIFVYVCGNSRWRSQKNGTFDKCTAQSLKMDGYKLHHRMDRDLNKAVNDLVAAEHITLYPNGCRAGTFETMCEECCARVG